MPQTAIAPHIESTVAVERTCLTKTPTTDSAAATAATTTAAYDYTGATAVTVRVIPIEKLLLSIPLRHHLSNGRPPCLGNMNKPEWPSSCVGSGIGIGIGIVSAFQLCDISESIQCFAHTVGSQPVCVSQTSTSRRNMDMLCI